MGTKKKSNKKARKESKLTKKNKIFPVVGVGVSAGGLEAFSEFLRSLPSDINAAIIFIQHLSPEHKSGLPDILSRITKIPVSEVKNGMKVVKNHIYVMPPGVLMSLENKVFKLTRIKKSEKHHLPIDYFFSSLAKDQGARAIGVVLSGTASDGTAGLKAIKEVGGITFAQDESAKYDSMPQSAILAECVDRELSPSQMATEISRLSLHPDAPYFKYKIPEKITKKELSYFENILAILKNATGVDFTYYKQTTIRRRMKRRMLLDKIDTLKKYIIFLHENPSKLEALHQDLLITVTSFFREPQVFNVLGKKIIPEILKNKSHKGTSPKEPIRVWVVGCSTGEEAFSVAMTFLEKMDGNIKTSHSLRIFSTDVNEKVIEKARRGFFSDNITKDVSAERLKRFFLKTDTGYQINKQIRDMCIFAKHDVIKDPPFSKMDLICCRNVLIYFDSVLQKKVLPRLHYSLEPHGYLCLGPAETIGTFENLFSTIDKKHKIYLKKDVLSNVIFEKRTRMAHVFVQPSKIEKKWTDFQVTKDEQMNILKHEVDRVLTALKSIKEEKKYIKSGKEKPPSRNVSKLRKELDSTKEHLNSVIESHEATTEELKSTNEEIQSSNEELQSMNEELETSKEELQSTNEELVTLNEELQNKNDSLEEAKAYVDAILDTANEAFIILDENLRVITANRYFYQIFQVLKKETEKRLIYNLGNRQWDIPKLRELLEEILPNKNTFENYEVTHTFKNIGEKTMLLNARQMVQKGSNRKMILLAISDITDRKKIEKIEDFMSRVSHELRTPLTTMRSSLEILEAKMTGPLNKKQEELIKLNLKNVTRLNRLINDLLNVDKFEKGKVLLKKKKVDFKELIFQTTKSFSTEISKNGVSLKVDVPKEKVMVDVDSDRALEVLSNLLHNALKFTQKGAMKITLEDHKTEIICTVSDTGRGISKEDIPHLFSKFEQFGRKAAGGAQGTGLGLALSKNIIELHGGEIKCESELNKGSTFIFTLPKAKEN